MSGVNQLSGTGYTDQAKGAISRINQVWIAHKSMISNDPRDQRTSPHLIDRADGG